MALVQSHSTLAKVLNALGFNACWLGLVVFGDRFIAIAIVWIALHLMMTANKRAELLFLLTVAALGITIDICLTLVQFFTFSAPSLIIPNWLIALWFCFAATLNVSLSFLNNSLIRQLLVGGLIAPLSYLAGAKLGAVELNLGSTFSYLVLATVWALLMPLFYALQPIITPPINTLGSAHD